MILMVARDDDYHLTHYSYYSALEGTSEGRVFAGVWAQVMQYAGARLTEPLWPIHHS